MRGFRQPLNRFGGWYHRLVIGQTATPTDPPLHLLPSAAPTVTATEGDIYFDGTAEVLAIHDGTQYRKIPDRSYAKTDHQLVADMVDKNFFCADRPVKTLSIQYVATTPESAGTCGFIIRRCQGTEAPSAGDALATVDAVGAALVANTVYTATLTETAADLVLAAGDRYAIDFTGDTPGELAGLSVTVAHEPA